MHGVEAFWRIKVHTAIHALPLVVTTGGILAHIEARKAVQRRKFRNVYMTCTVYGQQKLTSAAITDRRSNNKISISMPK